MATELRGKLQEYVPKAGAKDAPEAKSEVAPAVAGAEGDSTVVNQVADKAEASV